MGTQQGSSWSWARFLAALPLVGFFCQFFFSTPEYEMLEKILNILGVLSALLLVVVYAIPGTVSFDELSEADQRFSFNATFSSGASDTPSAAWWQYYFKTAPSFTLGASLTVSGFCFSVVFIGVICLYLYASFAKGMVDKIAQRDKEAAEGTWALWYKINAILYLSMLIGMICGMITFYLGLYVLCLIKWPDYGLLAYTGTDYSKANLDKQSKVYHALMVFNLIVPVAVAGLIVVGGVANYIVVSRFEQPVGPAQVAPAKTIDGPGSVSEGQVAKGAAYPRDAPLLHESEEH